MAVIGPEQKFKQSSTIVSFSAIAACGRCNRWIILDVRNTRP